jgi:hypothetical protein
MYSKNELSIGTTIHLYYMYTFLVRDVNNHISKRYYTHVCANTNMYTPHMYIHVSHVYTFLVRDINNDVSNRYYTHVCANTNMYTPHMYTHVSHVYTC